MDFLIKCFICLLFSIGGGFSLCTIEIFYDCTCTITCTHRPSAVNILPCRMTPNVRMPSNVTLIIKDSTLDTLTRGFFAASNFDGKVKYIISQNNDWNTIETNTFQFYSKVLLLNLSSSGIVNLNDDAFNQIIFAKTLDLSNNKIERLFPRSLFIARDNVLENLDLSRNRLTYLQDDAFSSLTKLIKLNLQSNNIASMTKDCFNNLRSLTIMFLQSNNITTFNSSFLVLKELKYLDVSNNKIKKVTGDETRSLSALIYLNISFNELESIEDNCFSQTQNLEFLDLSHNKISSAIEPAMFLNNHLLRYLNLFENKLTTIKNLSFQYNPLEYINFERNNLSIDVNRDILKGLSKVKYINITQQNISVIKENAFVDMLHLQYLNLSKNHIVTVDNTSFEFENGSTLTVLDLSYNCISDLHFLQNFTSVLKEIYISNNKLTALQTGIFEGHKKLIRLDISENKIIVIEPHSLPLGSLQYLNIKGNNLKGNISKYMFSPAPYLRYLDIDNFKYKGINENAFDDLQLLTKLNLSNNELEFVDSNNFRNMEKMYSLDMSNNMLTEFNATNLDKLKAIYLNNNYLTQLPNLFSNVSEVLYIDVSNNFISDLTNAGFENVRNCTVLKMAENGIKYFNSEQTNNLTKLSDLVLNSNHISEIKLFYFESLVSLDLNNNNISSINLTTFDKLYSLQYLDLSDNKISKLLPGSFQQLKILKFLNLSSNHITNLRYGTFRGLSKTETIDISRNKLSNLDVHIFHECHELRKLIIDYNFIKTVNVDKLILMSPRIMSLSVGGNPISCEEIIRNNRLKESRRFEVTSIHKVFHEDNVYGVKCGDTIDSSSTESSRDLKERLEHTENSTSTVLIAWCSVLTILAVAAVAYFCYYKRIKFFVFREPRTYHRNSINVNSVDYDNDLLS